jgi:tape measure domain-containing protein
LPVRAADLETRLYATDREYNKTLADGERRAERFVSNVNRNFGRVGQIGGGGVSRGIIPGLAQISEIVQGIPQIGRLAGSLLDPLKDATEEGIRFNMMVGSAGVGFKGVAGSIENARKHVAALRQFGEDSPLFDSSGLIRTSRLMNVFGFELSEHIPKIKIWGDAIASSGEMSEETLLGVARAFGQIKSLGRVNAEEMNQLAERGIPAWELLAKAIGKTVAETRKLGEQGRLKGGPAVEAITAMIAQDPRFKGTAEGLAGTLQGRLARVGEIRERAQGIATQGLTGDISLALDAALKREDLAVTMAQGIGAAIAPVSGLVRGAIVTTVGGGITGGFEEAFNAAKSVLPVSVTDLVNTGILAPMFKAAGVQSPSTKTRYIGFMLAAGLQEGLAEGLRVNRFSEEIEALIREAAERFGLDPNLIRAVIRQESGGRTRATSPVGAKGLMQLMDGTAARYGVTNSYDPRQNIMAGSKYLAELLAEFKDVRLALAGYNAGEGAVRAFLPNRPDANSYIGGSGRRWTVSEEAAQRAQGIPQNGQTPGYVRNIMGELGRAGGASVQRQLDLLWGMAEKQGLWGAGRYKGGDLSGGTGVFASGGIVDFPFQKTPGFDLTASKAVSTLSGGLRDAKEIQFDLLKAMGETGPVAEAGFGQAVEAARNWAAEVIDSGKKANTFLGISSRDAAGAFEDAWVNTFTQTDLSFKGMASSFVLTFSQSLNQMVQQWAAAQISAGLGKFLSWGLNALAGAFTGGISGSSGSGSFLPGGVGIGTSIVPIGGHARGTMSAPPGLAWVGEAGPELMSFRGGERVYNNTDSRKMIGGQTVYNTYNITTPPVRERSYTQPRSRRELADALAAALRQRV